MQCDINKTPQEHTSLSLNHEDSNEFLAVVTNAIATGKKTIHINCSHLKNITSSRISLLREVHQLCKISDVNITLYNVSNQIQNVFKTLDLYKIFTIKQSDEVVNKITKKENTNVPSRTIAMFSKKFIPTSENIMNIKYQIHQLFQDSLFSDQFVYEIETIFYEAVTNIRLHAQLKKLDVVEFYLSQENNNIVMKFIDNGIPFDMTENKKYFDPNHAITSKKRNGLGIHMMYKMTDKITYKRIDDKNVLEFCRGWREQND